jgi:sirohydrochlorin ferrochelatase
MTSHEPLADMLGRLADGSATPADLAALAAAARDGTLRLVSNKGGRRPIADDAALAEMRLRVEEGESPWKAARHVARAVGGHSFSATAARLLRKFKNHSNKNC